MLQFDIEKGMINCLSQPEQYSVILIINDDSRAEKITNELDAWIKRRGENEQWKLIRESIHEFIYWMNGPDCEAVIGNGN